MVSIKKKFELLILKWRHFKNLTKKYDLICVLFIMKIKDSLLVFQKISYNLWFIVAASAAVFCVGCMFSPYIYIHINNTGSSGLPFKAITVKEYLK